MRAGRLTGFFKHRACGRNATIYAFPYSDVVGTFIMNPTGPENLLRCDFGYYAVEGRPPVGCHEGVYPLDE